MLAAAVVFGAPTAGVDVELVALPTVCGLPATGRAAPVVVNLEELTYAAAVAGREGGLLLVVIVVDAAREVVVEAAREVVVVEAA